MTHLLTVVVHRRALGALVLAWGVVTAAPLYSSGAPVVLSKPCPGC